MCLYLPRGSVNKSEATVCKDYICFLAVTADEIRASTSTGSVSSHYCELQQNGAKYEKWEELLESKIRERKSPKNYKLNMPTIFCIF